MNETRQETIQRIHDVGNVSGSCINAIFTYLELQGEKERIPHILEKAQEYGGSMDSAKVNPLGRYPMRDEVALLFAVYDVLGWDEAQMKELGRNIPRVSLLIKLFLKYFVSLEATTKQTKTYWKRHYDFGDIDVVSTDIESGNYLVEVCKFDIHPLYAEFLCGFIETMVAFVVPQPIGSEVIKVSTEGDGVNRFRLFYLQ